MLKKLRTLEGKEACRGVEADRREEDQGKAHQGRAQEVQQGEVRQEKGAHLESRVEGPCQEQEGTGEAEAEELRKFEERHRQLAPQKPQEYLRVEGVQMVCQSLT
jgi:hypothetical protein